MNKILTLYIGDHCHLCDQAKAVIYPLLTEFGWQLNEVNINSDPALKEQYGIRIPVVAVPDGEEKGWPFTQGQVKRLMGC
jgi:hypothetical protein